MITSDMDAPPGAVHFFSYQTFLLKKHVDLFSRSGILVNMDNEKVIVEALARRAKPKAKKPKAKRRRVKPEKVSTIQNRLYKKWSEVVRAMAGNKCEVCGAEGKLDAHHVQPRQICSSRRFRGRPQTMHKRGISKSANALQEVFKSSLAKRGFINKP